MTGHQWRISLSSHPAGRRVQRQSSRWSTPAQSIDGDTQTREQQDGRDGVPVVGDAADRVLAF